MTKTQLQHEVTRLRSYIARALGELPSFEEFLRGGKL